MLVALMMTLTLALLVGVPFVAGMEAGGAYKTTAARRARFSESDVLLRRMIVVPAAALMGAAGFQLSAALLVGQPELVSVSVVFASASVAIPVFHSGRLAGSPA